MGLDIHNIPDWKISEPLSQVSSLAQKGLSIPVRATLTVRLTWNYHRGSPLYLLIAVIRYMTYSSPISSKKGSFKILMLQAGTVPSVPLCYSAEVVSRTHAIIRFIVKQPHIQKISHM